ncbi:MAG: pirin-like C-terminal cupin domain-containing protein [Lautropia sp.]|nr:pirin-like C-terminal cupin domain-containing protein [Lautropia sp.]
MRKTTIGVSRPLSAHTLASGWQEQLFFSYQGLGRQANPAIRASYAPPQTLPPTHGTTGSDKTVMSGFEAVTLLMSGDLQIRDSTGQQNLLLPGDVLWQGAGRGMQTEQRLGPNLTEQGGTLSLLTLWINLPASCKQIDPHHQCLPKAQIPLMSLPDDAGTLRLIAGEWEGQLGPAETVTPLQLWDIHLAGEHQISLPIPRGWYCLLLVLSGQLRLDFWPTPVKGPQLAFLDASGDQVFLNVDTDTHLVLLSAAPLDEPIVGKDSLVMNTAEQLADVQAAWQQAAPPGMP